MRTGERFHKDDVIIGGLSFVIESFPPKRHGAECCEIMLASVWVGCNGGVAKGPSRSKTCFH